ncbi:MAG TPA: hypothetical protein VIV11_30005 [Kofleriaceae bacterium]
MRGLVLVMLVGTATASAQPATTLPVSSTGAAPAAPPRPVCLVGGGSCSTVVLLETTWGIKPAVVGPTGYAFGFDLGLEGGFLVNAPKRHQGFGGSFGLRWVSEAEAAPFVIRGRYRSWLSPRSNVDVSAGLLLANVNRGGNGATAQLSIERSGKIALVMNIDVYATNRTENGTAFEVGLALKFCGFWSIPSALLTVLTAAALRGT